VAAARGQRPYAVTLPAASDGRAVRTQEDLSAELASAIASGQVPADPSAETIRMHLRIGAARARELRAGLRQ
jgi:hypothetical protein